jgi:hypothetical protein
MYENTSHAPPENLRSVYAWVAITVNPVNDIPVTWGSDWNVESNDAYDTFYGGNAWTYPAGYGEDEDNYDNTVCIDNCYYTEDFGIVGHYVDISPRELRFGGRDVEGDSLSVVIRSADCQGRNARWEMINSTGHFPVLTEQLVGMTLGRLVERQDNEGYKLVSMLTFAPARNDWNVLSEEPHEHDESGRVSPFYCQLTYAVVDSEGFASDDAEYGVPPKIITLQVRQQNDQPTDSVLQDPSQSSTLIGYEDNKLFIKFDASDVENDDFVFSVVECDNSRGKFFFPHSTQAQFILENGDLDISAPLDKLFDKRSGEIRCDQAIIPREFSYSSTNGKGWFLLFEPDSNDSGNEFASITVSYNDRTVVGQAPQLSERFINIRSVNDPPVISFASVAVNGDNQLIQPPGIPLALGISFTDIDAVGSDGVTEAEDLGFQIRVSSVELDDLKKSVADSFVYNIVAENLPFEVFPVPPTNENLGRIKWFSSISQANEIATQVSFVFNFLGVYTIEIVAVDNGFTGYCTPDVVLDETV